MPHKQKRERTVEILACGRGKEKREGNGTKRGAKSVDVDCQTGQDKMGKQAQTHKKADGFLSSLRLFSFLDHL